jgi:hypothetical protein
LERLSQTCHLMRVWFRAFSGALGWLTRLATKSSANDGCPNSSPCRYLNYRPQQQDVLRMNLIVVYVVMSIGQKFASYCLTEPGAGSDGMIFRFCLTLWSASWLTWLNLYSCFQLPLFKHVPSRRATNIFWMVPRYCHASYPNSTLWQVTLNNSQLLAGWHLTGIH